MFEECGRLAINSPRTWVEQIDFTVAKYVGKNVLTKYFKSREMNLVAIFQLVEHVKKAYLLECKK